MATDFTPNYNLDKYVATDKPNLRDQYNAAMDKIDLALLSANTNATDAKAATQSFAQDIAAKADQTDLDALAQTVNGKASQADLTTLANVIPSNDFSAQNTVKNALDLKANASALNSLATKTELQNEVTELEAADTEIKHIFGATNNPIDYGADPTGTNDSSNAINACIQANRGGCVVFAPGIYRIDSTIITPHGNITDRVSIDFNGSNIYSYVSNGPAFFVGGDTTIYNSLAGIKKTFFKNGTILNKAATTIGFLIKARYCDADFMTLNIIGFRTGIKLTDGAEGHPADANVDDCLIEYNDMTTNSIGIDGYLASDSKVQNSRIYGFKYALRDIPYVTNVHSLAYGTYDKNAIEQSAFMVFTNIDPVVHLTNCYCDSMGNFFAQENDQPMSMWGSMVGCNLYTFIRDSTIRYAIIRKTVTKFSVLMSGCWFRNSFGDVIVFERTPTNTNSFPSDVPTIVNNGYYSPNDDMRIPRIMNGLYKGSVTQIEQFSLTPDTTKAYLIAACLQTVNEPISFTIHANNGISFVKLAYTAWDTAPYFDILKTNDSAAQSYDIYVEKVTNEFDPPMMFFYLAFSSTSSFNMRNQPIITFDNAIGVKIAPSNIGNSEQLKTKNISAFSSNTVQLQI